MGRPEHPAFCDARTIDWLLASDEPAARWITLSQLLGRPPDDPDVLAAHARVLSDPGTLDLIGRLGDWDRPAPLGGHNSPAYAPNLLNHLADSGVGPGDEARVDAVLAAMLRHQDADGRFSTPSIIGRVGPDPIPSALLCDTHVILEVLVRYGQAEHPAVRAGLARMALDLSPTPQGIGWTCIPSAGFRGPGRKGEVCPQIGLEALRAISWLPPNRRPIPASDLLEVARTALRAWSRRGEVKPYMFGHGRTFKTVKWPPMWYGILGLLDAVGRYPELWDGPAARPEHRRAIA
jgi:hypothetical protein